MLAHATAPGDDSGQEDGGDCNDRTSSQSDLAEPATPADSKPETTSADSAKPDSVPALEKVWQEIVAEVYGDFVPSWTAKERGQMRRFREACPPCAAAPVLEACVRNWPVFGAMAKSDAGAWDLPARPTVGFILKFVGVAVNFWQTKTKPKIPPSPKPDAPKPQQTPAQSTVKLAPGEEKVSLEMVMAALFEPMAGGPPADN